MDPDVWKKLSELYYSPAFPEALSGQLKFFHGAKRQIPGLKLENVKEFLSTQSPYQLHAPVRRRFPRSKYFVRGPFDLLEGDLVDMSALKEWNDGITFVLVVIDAFSRYAWLTPLKSKTAKEVSAALATLFAKIGRPVENFQTDKGGEFVNALVIRICQDNNINFYQAQSEVHCAHVERLNRTLKTKIYKLLTHKNTWRYIDDLPAILEGYNNTVHSATKMAPSLIDESNRDEVFRTLYGDKKPDLRKLKPKFRVGQEVRISQQKEPFSKSYTSQWTDEIFTVREIKMGPVIRYILADIEGSLIKGSFYEPEMQLAALEPGKERELQIDKVLKRRTRNKVKEILVHWKNHPKAMDSWIRADTARLL